MQLICCALDLAFAKAGKSIAAKIAMMAITTRSSMRVNPFERVGDFQSFKVFTVFVGCSDAVARMG